MGRLYKPVECYSYARGFLHDHPALKVKLVNMAGESIEIELPVDTGFEGAVMLDSETYSFFAVGELPREAWRLYRSLAGPLPTRTARALAVLSGSQLEVLVETPLYGGGRRLLGRELLNRLTVVLDGRGRAACIAEPLQSASDGRQKL